MRRVYDEIAEEKLPQEKKQNLLLNLKQKCRHSRAGSRRAGWKNAA